ncbi:MAG: hypothetical protein KA063_04250 [Firmicutes bacterium]|nr:hypothetical protein [Bacillota bacterium]
MRVLLSFVGKQDPYSDDTKAEGGIVTLCRYVEPDCALLLHSSAPTGSGADSTDENAQNTLAWLQSELPSIDVHLQPLMLTDPRNHRAILDMTRMYSQNFLSSLPEDAEVVINTTSGTPQMHAVWLLLASSGIYRKPRLFEIANPKKMLSGEPRVTEISIPFMYEESLMSTARRYIEQASYVAAAETLADVARTSAYATRRFTAQALGKAMRAYSSWQVMQYDQAFQLLSSAANDCGNCSELASASALLSSQVRVLRSLAEHQNGPAAYKETFENLVDLYYNCVSQASQGDTAGCLARFWRLHEGLLHYHFREVIGVEPILDRNTPGFSQANEQEFSRYIATIGKRRGSGTIGMHALRDILRTVYRDKTFDTMEQMTVAVDRGSSVQDMGVGKALEYLRKRRNESIAAHGMRPVSKETANTCICVGRQMLTAYFAGRAKEFEDYPFSPDRVKGLSAALV